MHNNGLDNYCLGNDDIFLASAVLFLLLVGVIWLARPTRASAAAPESLAGGAH
jgi:DHA2 family multidrug resistance protein